MNKFANFIVKGRYWFLGIFFALLVASGVLMSFVNVNYDLTEYLPDNSSTKESISLMKEEFGATGTASIMLEGVSQDEATNIAEKVSNIESISTAVITKYQTKEDVGYALMSVFLIDGDYTQEAEQSLKEIENVLTGESGLLGENQNYYLTGSAQTAVSSRVSILGEIPIILLACVVIVILVLLFTTRSWIEPLIFLIVIGSAILINMGTNYFLGSISFISNSVSSVLLIALSMDYSIVLVSRFREEREKTSNVYEAMKNAITGSLITIVSSGLTVMAGLIALVFMDYKIGLDMGLVLTKGVFISLLAVIFLMPAVLLLFSKLLTKTEHKNFLKGLSHIGTFAKKTKWVFPIAFLCVFVGAFVVQHTMLNFEFTSKFNNPGEKLYENEQKVKNVFGEQNALVVILKTKDGENVLLTEEDQLKLFEDIKAIKSQDSDVINLGSSFLTSSGEVQSPVTGKMLTIKLGDKIDASFVSENFTKNYEVDEDSTELFTYLNQTLVESVNESGSAYVYEAIEFMGSGENKTQTLNALNQIIDSQIQLQTINDDDADEVKAQKQAINAKNGQLKASYAQICEFVASKYDKVQLGEDIYNSDSYTRMIFNIDAEVESDLAKEFITNLKSYLNQQEGLSYSIVSNTQNVLETEDVFKTDRLKVELITALAILLICILSFRSISLPVLLVAIIEGSIFINLAGNAIFGNAIFFICYLLGTAIQMGATIDYGILLCDRYKEARKTQDKYTAIKTAIDKSFTTIISSGTILTLAAFSIGIFSSIPLLKSIGYLIGVGALCASLSILFVLPQTLLLLDKFIAKTTYKSNFLFSTNPQKEKKLKKQKVLDAEAKKVEEKSSQDEN
ncbi:MAG: MMPL family transporter [Clostridia bacterium]|nr:MMPL family transporter [Clostridia bacterium]